MRGYYIEDRGERKSLLAIGDPFEIVRHDLAGTAYRVEVATVREYSTAREGEYRNPPLSLEYLRSLKLTPADEAEWLLARVAGRYVP